MLELLKAIAHSWHLTKEEKKAKKEKELQDKFWETQISFEE